MSARRTALMMIVFLFSMAPASFAQAQWREFVSEEDFFAANFPDEPVVTDFVWETEYGAMVPARVYTVEQGPTTFSVTVVDYNLVEEIHAVNSEECPPGLERCNGLTSFSGLGYWKNDVRGAMIYAAFRFMQRDVKLTHYMWNYLGAQAVESQELQLINNQDQSRTFVTLYMHHSRLYIMEGNVPANHPPPGLFVQSMSLREEDGSEANHERLYFNGPHAFPTETNEYFRGVPAGEAEQYQ